MWTCKWENMFLQQWVAQDGILLDHSSQHLLLTPFITWFLYPWKVTLCLHLLMKLSRISHLRRETSGKDCGWWVIDELDQFVPLIYLHPVTQKKVNFLMGIFCCFLCVHIIWKTAVKCFWNLQGRNVQSIRLHFLWASMRSHHSFHCRSLISLNYHHFSSYPPNMLMHLPHLGTSLKILSWWK